MDLKLNIYEKKNIIKTYTAETYDLMFGICEDVAHAIDIDSLKTGSDTEILKAILKLAMTSMDTIKLLMKDIFDGLTDEEIRKAKIKEMAQVLVDVVKYTISQLNLGVNSKN